jgi:hypothetical protein
MITKKIWIYWQQGWDKAPDLVKQCKDSWVKLNPDYEIHVLDQKSLFDHVDFPADIDLHRKDLDIQKVSALIRSVLLARYGGVWTDATVVCTRPLSNWLAAYYDSQFFAFRAPAPDRLISNWFIAAEAESVILQRFHKNFFDFYANNYFSNQGTVLGDMLLAYLNPRWTANFKATLKWDTWFVRKMLRVYPRFMHHYIFNKLVLTDPECTKLWDQVKPFPAEPPHRVQNFETVSDGIEKAMKEIDSGLTPMYKLNWRVDSSNLYWTTVLRHLKEQT